MEIEDYNSLLVKMELRERLLIGFLLLDIDAPTTVIVNHGIDRRVFMFAETRTVFVAIEEMFNQGLEIDAAEVSRYMIETGLLREINGLSAINDYILHQQLITQMCSEYTLQYLINTITAHYEYREMMLLLQRYDFTDLLGDITDGMA